MSILWKLCGIALLSVAACLVLGKERQWMVVLAASLLILARTVADLQPIAAFVREQGGDLEASAAESVATLWKGLGVGFLCGIGGSALREVQAGTAATALELYGKVQILLLCLPYLTKLLSLVKDLLDFGF